MKDIVLDQCSNEHCPHNGEEGLENEVIEFSRNSDRSEHDDTCNSSYASSSFSFEEKKVLLKIKNLIQS